MRHPLLVAALALCASSAALAPSPTYCRVTGLTDYTLGVAYRILLSLDPTCEHDAVGRVRKIGTLNMFSRYQPTKPGGLPQFGGLWGWNLNAQTSLVPREQLWTLFSWRWQWWDGQSWQPVEEP